MANGQTFDHRAKVSDRQIKRLVSKETKVSRGEVKYAKIRYQRASLLGLNNHHKTITGMMSRVFALCHGRCELKNCRCVWFT